jgi:hypothetical protein
MFMVCKLVVKKKTIACNGTGCKDDLRLRKSRLIASPPSPSCQFLHWHSRHWNKAVVGEIIVASWTSPIPNRSRGNKSVYDVRLRPCQLLEGEDDPLPGVEEDDDERHVRGGRSSDEDEAKEDDPRR